MISLPADDSRKLVELWRAARRVDVGRARDLVCGAAPGLSDPSFAYTYIAIRLAKRGDIDLALELLGEVRTKPFCGALEEYLRASGEFAPSCATFSTTTAYDVWIRTAFYAKYKAATLAALLSFTDSHAPSSATPTVVDIGPGNGVLLCEFLNAVVRRHRLERLHLVLVDKYASMLKATREYLDRNLAVEYSADWHATPLEDMPWGELHQACTGHRVWFVNCAASLHHMPRGQKKRALSNLRRLSAPIVLSEFEANHDDPREDTPDFVYSVTEFYGYFIADIMDSKASIEDRRTCVRELSLAEAITMLRHARRGRVDYHTPMARWRQIASSVGLSAETAAVTTKLDGSALTYTVTFKGIP